MFLSSMVYDLWMYLEFLKDVICSNIQSKYQSVMSQLSHCKQKNMLEITGLPLSQNNATVFMVSLNIKDTEKYNL